MSRSFDIIKNRKCIRKQLLLNLPGGLKLSFKGLGLDLGFDQHPLDTVARDLHAEDAAGDTLGLEGFERVHLFAKADKCDLGADTGVGDLDAVLKANWICNDLGMDPISMGATLAAAMELYEMGVITQQDSDGIELKFGNTEALCQITDLTATAEGFGKEIGQGSKRLCEKYGHPEFAMVVKGQEFPGYDPRGMQGMGSNIVVQASRVLSPELFARRSDHYVSACREPFGGEGQESQALLK